MSAAMARIAERDGMSKTNIERVLAATTLLEDYIVGLGFCLSGERDQLSQWRGYADDAAGVAVGFSKKYLEALQERHKNPKWMTFHLGKVEYDPNDHDSHVEPTYKEIKVLIEAGAFELGRVRRLLDDRTGEEVEADKAKSKELVEGISLATFMLFTKLYLLKSPAFREEKEWRLITYHSGQMGEDRREFRAAGDRIIPFESIVMEDLNVSPINEIILGPKHITPVSVIQSLLDKHGYVGVSVSRSAASYR